MVSYLGMSATESGNSIYSQTSVMFSLKLIDRSVSFKTRQYLHLQNGVDNQQIIILQKITKICLV